MKEAITLVLSVWNYCCGHRPHLLDLFAISQNEKMRHIYFPSNSQQQEQRNSLLGKYQFFLRRAFSASQKSRKCPSHFSKWSSHSSTHYWEERSLLCTHNHLGGSLPCLITLRCKFHMPTTCNLFDKETKWREFSEF